MNPLNPTLDNRCPRCGTDLASVPHVVCTECADCHHCPVCAELALRLPEIIAGIAQELRARGEVQKPSKVSADFSGHYKPSDTLAHELANLLRNDLSPADRIAMHGLGIKWEQTWPR